VCFRLRYSLSMALDPLCDVDVLARLEDWESGNDSSGKIGDKVHALHGPSLHITVDTETEISPDLKLAHFKYKNHFVVSVYR